MKDIENFIIWGWGKRCENKDTDDFPELKNAGEGRCACCEMWEHYDEYIKSLEKL